MKKRIIDTSVFCGILGIAMMILFHNYIFGDRYFLFPNVVTDGVVQFYPDYVQKASKGIGSFFSFSYAWGSNFKVSNPFELLITSFGGAHVAYMIGIAMVLKCMLAGIFFYGFLKEKGMTRVTSTVFALSYAFSVQVIGAGCWKSQAELAIIVAIFLWAIERGKKKRGIVLFALGILLTILCLGLYFKLMLIAFLVLYLVAELYQSNINVKRKLTAKQKRIIILGCALCMLVVMGVLWYKLQDVFQSYRFQAGVESLGQEWKKTFSYKNIQIIGTEIIRTFAHNVMGIPGANEYYGSDTGWYIGDGTYYCGILTVLLIPQIFHRDTKKRNLVVAVELGISSIIMLCPVFRLVLNGFSNDIYKLSRVWVILIMLITAAIALDEMITGKKQLAGKRLIMTWGITLAIVLVMCLKLQKHMYYYDVCIYLIVSALEVLLLWIYGKKGEKSTKFIRSGMVVLVVFEVLSLNYKFINNSDAVTKEAWITGYYNDGTKEILEQSQKDMLFERVDKTYQSVQLNDSAVQGYYGTAYYVGGVGKSSFTDFALSTSIPTLKGIPGWCLGTTGNIYLESLFSVNKIVANSDNCASYGFQLENNNNDKYLYKNRNVLPLGFCYDKAISQSAFEEIDASDRAESLLEYAVVEDGSDIFKDFQTEPKEKRKSEPVYTDEIASYGIGTNIGLPVEVTENETVVVEIEDSQEVSAQVAWTTEEGKFGYQYASCYEQNGKTKVEFSGQNGIRNIVIYSNSGESDLHLDKVRISVYQSEEYYKEFEKNIAERKSNVLQLEQCTEEYICGTIQVEKEQLLFFTIPYGAKFKYYIDGEEVKKEKVDMAFTGIYLPKGTHKVEIVY